MNKINNEPLKIIKTSIEYFSHSDRYRLDIEDQYGRWWIYSGVHGSLSLYEAEEIEAEELRKRIINLDLYYFDDDRIVERIKRQEEIMYVYKLNQYGMYGEGFDSDNGAQVVVMTKDFLEYIHDKIFYDYDKLKEFVLKIKAKGSINLEFWRCQGKYPGDEGGNSYLKEFEEKEEYYDEPHEWNTVDIYNSLGGEEGELKYMHDGAWISPDGTITYDR